VRVIPRGVKMWSLQVLMEGLSGEELYQVRCDVEVDVGVLHICPWLMGRIPDFWGVIGTPRRRYSWSQGAGYQGMGGGLEKLNQ